jgi:two-component system, sensor histidine kinase
VSSRPYKWWSSVSIVKKLYLVIGVMAVLIASELIVLRFAMRTLSASRAFVEGESIWSKYQKSAVTSLLRYVQSGDKKYYLLFQHNLEIPKGDHQVRIELLQEKPNLSSIREGFIKGQIQPADIDAMIDLLRRFYWVSYLNKAIVAWTNADLRITSLEKIGTDFHQLLLSQPRQNAKTIEEVTSKVLNLDEEMTSLESEFSIALGQGCRWLESVVMMALTIVVLTVESFGLTLAFLISRHLSRGLSHLEEITKRIGQGDFSARADVATKDEIGQLANGVNTMGALLKNSYEALEERVNERTLELYRAVESREEFLSIASHELKTPLTSLFLQIQMMKRALETQPEQITADKMHVMTKKSYDYATRMTVLIDRLLDLTRLRIGKFAIHRELCDVVVIVRDVTTQMAEQAKREGATLTVTGDSSATGYFDSLRIGELAMNFISNAIKYGDHSPVEISVTKVAGRVHLSVHDKGKGISIENQQRIFELFGRINPDPGVSGLGLGLYISNEIVKAHGGEIKVESELGIGTTLTAILPA